jgi:hypothetical protein
MSAARKIEAEPAGDEALNALVDLAEQAMRLVVEHGGGLALSLRAQRFLPTVPVLQPIAAPVAEPEAIGGQVVIEHLAATKVLGALRAARASRLTPVELAANQEARRVMVQAMREASGQ